MYRRIILALALVVALSSTALASAATKKPATKTHKLALHTIVLAHSVGSTSSGATIVAGAVTDAKLGSGATVYYVTTTATGQTATFTLWTNTGSVKGTATIALTPTASGASLVGTGKATGGTLAYKKVKGTIAIVGTVDKNGTFNLTITGNVTY